MWSPSERGRQKKTVEFPTTRVAIAQSASQVAVQAVQPGAVPAQQSAAAQAILCSVTMVTRFLFPTVLNKKKNTTKNGTISSIVQTRSLLQRGRQLDFHRNNGHFVGVGDQLCRRWLTIVVSVVAIAASVPDSRKGTRDAPTVDSQKSMGCSD